MKHYRHEPWDPTPMEDLASLYYGHLHEDPDGPLVEIPFTMYSDYSGSTVERSNCEVFLERFGKTPGVWPVYGGYGTCGVVVLVEKRADEEIKEVLDALEDYPLIDEEHMSNLELEIEDEDWDSWIKQDLRRMLGDCAPEDDDELYQQFMRAMDKTNTYFVHEDAVSAYVDLDRVLEGWPV